MRKVLSFIFLGLVCVGCGPQAGDEEVTDPVETSQVEAHVPEEVVPEPVAEKEREPIIDSSMTRAEALGANEFPKNVLAQMEVVKVGYLGFDGLDHEGQIVVNREVAEEAIAIFQEIREAEFPIVKVVPIIAYAWDDAASIADQNSSGFNYRDAMGPGVKPGHLSRHARGMAIDLNPYQNPFVAADGSTPRPYVPGEPGVLTSDSAPVRIFKRYGWKWGGDWTGAKDYQHFEKG